MPRKQIVGQDYERWKSEVLKDLSESNAEGYAEVVLTIGGSRKTFEIHEEPIFDIFQNLVGQLCIFRDVTVERALEQQILHNSNTDFMTGLYNRRCFYDYINKNRGAQRVSLIYLDLDHFKCVNDTFGHQVGDEALILTARLLRESFPDTFITRLGGDEFLITLLGPWEIDELESWAGRLIKRMERAFQASPQLSLLTVSIGIAQTDDREMKIDTLLRQSDMALYAAKESGRACYRTYAGQTV